MLTRWPAPSRCKSRLAEAIGPERAAAVQRRLLHHGLAAARQAAQKNAPQVNAAIDKAATAAKSKLGPEHHAKIDSGTRMAKKAVTGDQPPTR
jgi:glycosyltransferase A (GT-A) superfamily protein (DUF2064 family)